MLDNTTTDRTIAEAALQRSTSMPRLCSIKRARAEWGDCGTTRFYEIVREHNVRLHKIGSKTVVTGEDVNRVADAIIAAARSVPIDAKALASRSVAARLGRRGSRPAQRARVPAQTTVRRVRRGCTAT